MDDPESHKFHSASSVLVLFVNGKKVEVSNPDPETTLLQFLRYKLCLTGTKMGCAEGGCGACTVMISRFDVRNNVISHHSANACLAPLCSMHGLAITTVEGLGSVQSTLHPVQRAIAEAHGSQCGFCTPGFVMSMCALLRNNPRPSKKEIIETFDGNLCRCTGYRPILEGLYAFSKETNPQCPMGENCCQNSSFQKSCCGKNMDTGCENTTTNTEEPSSEETKRPTCASCQAVSVGESQQMIFPPELKLLSPTLHSQSLEFTTERVTWLRPTTLEQLLDIKAKYPHCKLVAGNTEIGIDTKYRNLHYPVLVQPSFVDEMRRSQVEETGIRLGAASTLSEVKEFLGSVAQDLPEEDTRVCAALLEMLNWFGGNQIRNVATLAGNIVNASPLSDLMPLLMASCARIEVASKEHGSRHLHVDETFLSGYKQTKLKDDEVMISITLPLTHKDEHLYGFKQAGRKDDDLTIANAGMYLNLDLDNDVRVIKDIRLAFGGMAAQTVMATKTAATLKGRVWDPSIVDLAFSDDMLPSDLPLAPGSPGGMLAFRRTLTHSFFFRFFHLVSQKLIQQGNSIAFDADASAGQALSRDVSTGSQVYAMPISGTPSQHAVGAPLVHVAAYKQCTGEAFYVDDIPLMESEVFLGLVTSKVAHGKIVSVDPSRALAMTGVVDYVDHSHVPAANQWDSWEFVFADGKVEHEGQVIAAVVATTHRVAQRAAKCVDVVYDPLEPVVTIDEALRKESFYPQDLKLSVGDTTAAFAGCDHVVEGSMHVNAQEHFYLEPQACVAYPRDGDEIEVIATSQSPAQMQKTLGRVLGYDSNHIRVKTRRLGGGFGGKETRTASIILPAAVAAIKTKRPVRCVLDRDEDMCLTGTRHPAKANYKIGFTGSGKIRALEMDLYLNMGFSLDLSLAVLETAILSIENAYKIDNLCVRGRLCPTNIPSCTAFRGFGGPQSIMIMENCLTHVASHLEISPEQVRELNFFQEGDSIPCGQTLDLCNLGRCWDECVANSDFANRRKAADEFNRNNRWQKKGLAVMPLKYGLAFLAQSMNQGGALVQIYIDGSVLVTHGGVEMGQGLHTKMIQVASTELGVPVPRVHITETSTSTVPNTSATAASMSSDLYGGAVIDACATLNTRLAPYKQADPEGNMTTWAEKAFRDRICLSAVGFYKLEGVSLDWDQKVNNPFSYFSFGAACSEVLVDCLTGDHRVLRTDIVMDVGQSLNPAIDVGQIEGAFLQGYGMMVLEDYKMSPSGVHQSRGPATYKIPACTNIPQVFNVCLLKDSRNPRALYSSKGIGEPPLCLATSVFLAIKDAVMSARSQNGHSGHFQLDSPATPEKIRMACLDDISQQFQQSAKDDEQQPWSVKL